LTGEAVGGLTGAFVGTGFVGQGFWADVGVLVGGRTGAFVGERVGDFVGLAVGRLVGLLEGGAGAGQTGGNVGRGVGAVGQGLVCRSRFRFCGITTCFRAGSSSMKRWSRLSSDLTSIPSIRLGSPPSLSPTST
jgi:hypothetical protein